MLRQMTVAHVRERGEWDHAEILFLESARFYRLPKAHPAFDEALGLLRAAAGEGRALEIGLASLDSDVIETVREVAG